LKGSSIYERLGLKKIINAGGRFTALGASLMTPEVVEAMVEAARSYVVIDDLQEKANEVIARITGAEAGYVTTGAAAGIAIATAACMTGKDLTKIQQLPDATGMKDEVIIQRGHFIFFARMARIAGAKLVEVGDVNGTQPEQIEGAINEKTAAILYIVSHHCMQKGIVPLEKVIEIAHRHGVPVIVDAAAEVNLNKNIALGADLVTFSGGKAIEGPGSSGILCGRKDLIEACVLQEKNIARTMKVSKEEIVGLLAALERYEKKDRKAEVEAWNKKAEYIADQLEDLPYVTVSLVSDEAERPIKRTQLKLDEERLGFTANEVYGELKSGNPRIFLRPHYLNLGMLLIDPRPMAEGDEVTVVNRIKEIFTKKSKEYNRKRC